MKNSMSYNSKRKKESQSTKKNMNEKEAVDEFVNEGNPSTAPYHKATRMEKIHKHLSDLLKK